MTMAMGVLLSISTPGRAEDEHVHERPPERAAALAQAELAMSRGEADRSLQGFERAAALEHAPDIELGLVRSHMQAGEYRRAMAFAAHTAGAHGEEIGGALLYAWLLNAGGQGAFARQLLEGAAKRAPDQPLLAQAQEQLRSPWPVPRGALLSAPLRLAPYAKSHTQDDTVPATARVQGSGVLIDEGRRALVPVSLLPSSSSSTVWVRNGLGLTSKAQVERRFDALKLVMLKLNSAMDGQTPWRPAPRDPFPGSPGYTLEYAATPDAFPAWPLLRLGFLGGPQSPADSQSDGTGLRHLGIEVPAGPRGGPVLDAAGRLVGIAADGDLQVPLSRLIQAMGPVFGPATELMNSASPRMPLDEIYERSLPLTLQVMTLPK